jgi:hypothetical protein
MSLPQPVRLYDQRLAPNPRRVNIFMAEKGIEIERVNVDLIAGEHKQPDYLAKIGVPQVPALELDDGTVLTETVAICRYFEALQPEPNMMGRDVSARSNSGCSQRSPPAFATPTRIWRGWRTSAPTGARSTAAAWMTGWASWTGGWRGANGSPPTG